MKIVGLIVEYNPLHNGHVYHFNEVKKQSNADLMVAIMSGNISMRGEVSVFNKFDKTKLALEMGVDLIIEIPTILSMQNADNFGFYSVYFLNLLNVDEIWIGSETNDFSLYEKYHQYMNSTEYNNNVKKLLSNGLSYKQATNDSFKLANLEPLLSNDILGLSYYKAIKKLNSNIQLKTIKRIGNNYLDDKVTELYSSAKAIRNNESNIKDLVPNYVYETYLEKGFHKQEKIFKYLKLSILNNPNLGEIFLCDEGFDNSLKKVYLYKNYSDFFTSLKTKRYTDSRINRTIWYTLFSVTKDDLKKARDIKLDFIRVLGYNNLGKSYLNSIKKNIVIYTNIKNNINYIFDLELKITKIFDNIYDTSSLEQEQKGPISK